MSKLAIVTKTPVKPAFEETAGPAKSNAPFKCVIQHQRPRYATPEDERIAMHQQQYGYDL
jgi:hypothetical protein